MVPLAHKYLKILLVALKSRVDLIEYLEVAHKVFPILGFRGRLNNVHVVRRVVRLDK